MLIEGFDLEVGIPQILPQKNFKISMPVSASQVVIILPTSTSNPIDTWISLGGSTSSPEAIHVIRSMFESEGEVKRCYAGLLHLEVVWLVGWLLFDVISTTGGGSVLEMTKFV